MPPERFRDVVVSTEFPPTVGGAHGWLYEVYRRWPQRVLALTQALAAQVNDADRGTQVLGSLTIRRVLPDTPDISVASGAYWRALFSQARLIRSSVLPGRHRLHALRAFPEGIAALCSRLLAPASTSIITYAHGEEMSIARSSRQLHAACRLVYRASTLVIANSRNTARLVRQMEPAARVACIHPGVDSAAIAPGVAGADDVRLSLPWPADTLVLCTVARMELRKNQAGVIAAIARLRREGGRVAYICAGDGPEAANLRRLAADSGVADLVLFPGAVSDARRNAIIGASDVYIMPSIEAGHVFEGFGMVFLEAAACGLPSIAGNSGGQPEAVLHGETGLVVDGSQPEEICAAIRRLMDPALRRAMGSNARAWAVRNDWQAVTDATWSAVDQASAAKGRAR